MSAALSHNGLRSFSGELPKSLRHSELGLESGTLEFAEACGSLQPYIKYVHEFSVLVERAESKFLYRK